MPGSGRFRTCPKARGLLPRRYDLERPDGSHRHSCHYDIQRCETRTSDIPLLKASAPLIHQALQSPQEP